MGRLAGIARLAERRGPIELLESVEVTREAGVAGDRNGGKSSRQVSLIEAGDWATATAEVGVDIPWWERRSNLLVEEIDLPHGGDARLRIGEDVVLEIRAEIDPCDRMEELAPGLRDALRPDWRGGVGGKVIVGGTICIGDEVRIDE